MPITKRLEDLVSIIAGNPQDFQLEKRFLNLCLFYIFIYSFFALAENYFLTLDVRLNYALPPLVAGFGLTYYLSRIKRQFKTASWIAPIIGMFTISSSWLFSGGTQGATAYVWVLVFGILPFISVRPSKFIAIVMFLVLITVLFLHHYYTPSFYSATYSSVKEQYLDLYMTLVFVALMLFMTINFAIKNYKQAKHDAEVNYVRILDAKVKAVKQHEKQKELIKKLSLNEKKLKNQQDQLDIIHKTLKHDISNNLSSISSSVKLFNSSGDREFLNDIQKLVTKSADLIRNMREQELLIKRDDNKLHYALSEIFNLIRCHHPYVNITMHEDCHLIADQSIFSIFDNLINNALIHGKTDKIDIEYAIEKTSCCIKVIDYGVGIPDTIKTQVFQEGFKYGSSGNTGVGLYLVKKSIERLGGNIQITDTQPSGVTFVITLKHEISLKYSKGHAQSDFLN